MKQEMKQNFTLFTCILCFLGIFILTAASIASNFNQGMIYTQNNKILTNQNKILIELSKKYPVYEINLSKQPKTKIKKIKELEKEIQKLLKEG